MKKQNAEISETRKNQVGSGDRSERIRTYNFPQGRVTDHRIGLTSYSLENFLNGEIPFMIDALTTHYQAEALKQSGLRRRDPLLMAGSADRPESGGGIPRMTDIRTILRRTTRDLTASGSPSPGSTPRSSSCTS